MAAEVKVYFAGEHQGKTKEAENIAWKGIALDKMCLYKNLTGCSYPMTLERVVSLRLKRNGYSWDWDILSWPKCAYITDLMRCVEESGSVSGHAKIYDNPLVWLSWMKEFYFTITVLTDDPHTAKQEIDRKLALMDAAYPNSIVKKFYIRVDVVQPIDAAMVKLETGIAAIEEMS